MLVSFHGRASVQIGCSNLNFSAGYHSLLTQKASRELASWSHTVVGRSEESASDGLQEPSTALEESALVSDPGAGVRGWWEEDRRPCAASSSVWGRWVRGTADPNNYT